MTLTHTVDTALLAYYVRHFGPDAIVDPELAKLVVQLIEAETAKVRMELLSAGEVMDAMVHGVSFTRISAADVFDTPPAKAIRGKA